MRSLLNQYVLRSGLAQIGLPVSDATTPQPLTVLSGFYSQTNPSWSRSVYQPYSGSIPLW
jgi:hypothetical protein